MNLRDSTSQWKFWRVPQLGRLELLRGSNITHYYPPHVHEEFCIALILGGSEITDCRDGRFTALPGNLSLLNPDKVHASESVRASYRIIRIRPDYFGRIWAEVTARNDETPRFTKFVVDDAPLFSSLHSLHRKLEQNLSALEQESELVSAIGLLINGQTDTRPSPRAAGREPQHVRKIRDYLKAHYAENVSLSDLTSITNLSPFYLLRAFRNQIGFPPHEYQTQVRIARARKLLLEGRAIAEAALETGFYDQSHLSRNFKRIVGLTPGQFLSQGKIVQDSAESVW